MRAPPPDSYRDAQAASLRSMQSMFEQMGTTFGAAVASGLSVHADKLEREGRIAKLFQERPA